MGWFLAPSVVAAIRREKVAGVMSLVRAMLLVFGLLVVGSMFIGPVGVLLLLVPALGFALKVVFTKSSRAWSQPVARDLKIVSTAGLVAFVGMISYSIYVKQVRNPTEYILRWENYHTARVMVEDLARAGPESLPDLRELVKKGGLETVAVAAEGLAEFGVPETDVPLLIQALGRLQLDTSRGEYVEKLGEALRKLSGLDLPKDASFKTWLEHWKIRGDLQQEID
jgi:hypothetical protein